MFSLKLYFEKFNWPLTISALLLAVIGLVSIYSSSLRSGDFLNLKKQIVFLGIGFVLMFIVSLFDWRLLQEDSYVILALYLLCILLLAGLLLFGPEIRGVRSWYKIGPISLDPIEFTKIVLIVLLAKYFSMRHIEMYRVIHILISGIYVFIPSVLIFFQPDLGSVMVLVSLWVGILVISGIKLRHFLILLLCGILILFFSWSTILKPYQKERILNFLRPQASEALEIGWNQRQSKIAIGSGGIYGQGIGNGSQTQNGFLPETQTDFVFASIAEETGLIGVGVLFLLFLFLIWQILKIAMESESNFPRFFAVGFAILLLSQIFIHVGMNIGILPIVGIPMPLISYGGSGLMVFFTSLGILQSIKRG